MAENNDVLKITIQFNKKKIQLQEVGITALPTYQGILDIFRNIKDEQESDETSEKTAITDY